MLTIAPCANIRSLGIFAFFVLEVLRASCNAAVSNGQYAGTTSNFNLPVAKIERTPTRDTYIDTLLYQADIERLSGDKVHAAADYRLALSWMQSQSAYNYTRAETLWLLGSLVEQDDPLAAAKMLAEAIVALHSAPAAEPLLIGLKRAHASELIDAHDFVGAVAMAHEAYDAAKQSKGDLDPLTIESLQVLTAALYNQTKYEESRKCGSELLRTAEQAFGEHHWEVARAEAFIGASDVAAHRSSQALPELSKAISIWNEYPNHPAAEYAFATSNFTEAALAQDALGAKMLSERRWADAESIYVQALPWAEKYFQTSNKSILLQMLNGLGVSEFMQGRRQQAEQDLRRAVELARPDGNSPELSASLDYLSRSLDAQKKHAEAMQFSKAALAVTDSIDAPQGHRADLLESATMIHVRGGDFAAAVEFMKRAKSLRAPGSAEASGAAYWIAMELVRLNQLPEAESYARQALELHTQCCGDRTGDDVDQDYLLLAHILSRRNHRHDEEAEYLFRKSISIRATFGSKSLAEAKLFFALFLIERHRNDEARTLLTTIPEATRLADSDSERYSTADLQYHEERLHLTRETSRYCSTATDSRSAKLCKTLRQRLAG